MKLNNETIREAVELWLWEKDKCLENFGHISNWDVTEVTDMSELFPDPDDECCFNDDISEWDVSNVENMYCMFKNSQFTGDISKWDVSNYESLQDMLSGLGISLSGQ